MSERAYLVLEDGSMFAGYAFGAHREQIGEVVFTTGMTGYLETLTDKSYFGQIVTQTFPLIGNYGVIPDDFESESIGPSAYIVKSWCDEPSNFRATGHIDSLLRARGIPGIWGIDTRALTKRLRERGVMNGKLTYRPEPLTEEIANYRIVNAVECVSTKHRYAVGEGRLHIALLDFGLKQNIVRELVKRGCKVTVCPCHTRAAEIAALHPDGIMLSNGPGDPADNPVIIENLRGICRLNIPLFGICLGHQLLALAHGFSTVKLKYGHRGANQPVRDHDTQRVYLSSQNHGYAVQTDSIDAQTARTLFSNVNDGTCEGISYRHIPAFSVQFHPEACAGPRDTAWLFERFLSSIVPAR